MNTNLILLISLVVILILVILIILLKKQHKDNYSGQTYYLAEIQNSPLRLSDGFQIVNGSFHTVLFRPYSKKSEKVTIRFDKNFGKSRYGKFVMNGTSGSWDESIPGKVYTLRFPWNDNQFSVITKDYYIESIKVYEEKGMLSAEKLCPW